MRVLLVLCLTGCASSNTMWNAEQRAKDARRLEQQGQASEARAQWAQAASKAAKVGGEKALVLRVEALARSGACQDIDEPLAAARANGAPPSTDRGVRERLDLADAECALAIGDARRAQAALGDPLESGDADRRARAEYVAGRVAMLQQDYEAATAHFNRAREPDAAVRAFIAAQRALIARAAEPGDLSPIATELSRALRTGSGTDEAAHLIDLITAVQTVPANPSFGARLHVAELARDSLQAPRLAGRLFLEAAASDTASLFAPKALIAAMSLLPEHHDSIAALLDARYATSPYSRALHGEASVAYTAAEDSLARELGMQGLIQRGASSGPRPGGPSQVTGPRGPKLP